MSTKPKAFVKHPKGKKKKEQTLDTADDYLAAGVDEEDALGKWRAGDASKSLRFGRKALDLYAQGLSRWPRNFDLAYNKARLELELATHPLLVKVLDVPLTGLLQQSLASHQYASNISPDNADTLFNTAQVLTALAELSAKDDTISETTALQYLEMALQMQQRCFEVQKVNYSESRQLQEQAANMANESEDDDGGAELDSKVSSAYEEREEVEQWFSMVEPVTADTLLDTLLAQFSTLTTLCSIVSSSISAASDHRPSISLQWIEDCATKIAGSEFDEVAELKKQTETPRTDEIVLTKVILEANILNLAYRMRSITSTTYTDQLEKSFSAPTFSANSSPEGSIAFAKALIAYNAALADVKLADEANARWNALSKAQKLLTSAANIPSTKADPSALATTHLLRGDISLSLQALAYAPIVFAQAVSNRSQLLKNGEVFYRNASKLFATSGEQEEKETADFRGAMARVLQLQTDPSSSTSASSLDLRAAEAILQAASTSKTDKWRHEQLQDMAEDGLIEPALFGLS